MQAQSDDGRACGPCAAATGIAASPPPISPLPSLRTSMVSACGAACCAAAADVEIPRSLMCCQALARAWRRSISALFLGLGISDLAIRCACEIGGLVGLVDLLGLVGVGSLFYELEERREGRRQEIEGGRRRRASDQRPHVGRSRDSMGAAAVAAKMCANQKAAPTPNLHLHIPHSSKHVALLISAFTFSRTATNEQQCTRTTAASFLRPPPLRRKRWR